MKKSVWLLLWPGLAPLWQRGSGRGLAAAAAFGILLNFALVTTFLWPQLLSKGLAPWVIPAAAWVLVLGFWIVAARAAARFLAHEAARQSRPANEANRLLLQAQTEYLKGHLSQAGSLLTRLLESYPDDAEARLLLATLCRRTGRTKQAHNQLTQLAQLPEAATWKMEIETERTLTRSVSEGESPMSRAA